MSESLKIAWLSVDPVRRKVDFYPRHIAKRLEKTYYDYHVLQNTYDGDCVLGKDFFNATVHLLQRNNFYQTTDGFNLGGRGGFKQPGYRSVKRIIVPDNKKIQVYSVQIRTEWRITNDIENADKIFQENVPDENIILLPDIYDEIDTDTLTYWSPEQLDTEIPVELEKNIVVWQWCFGTKEKQGDLVRLEDKWWIPYLYQQNKMIEEAFSQNEDLTKITIPFDNSERIIKFNNQSIFAKQLDETGTRVRFIRRNIISVGKLIELLKNENSKPIDPEELLKYIDENEIPHEFYCSISQDIMKDPVKTIDGFTYDRESIEKWLATSWKSPLTGLELQSKTIVQNDELKIQIDEFYKKLEEKHKESITN
jgi:hypothetical protein